ncbi:MAG: 3-oxoacyl-ACP synthase [Rhodospirillales bacterium]|nr:3-oxoacyl-ACP synthase [Rhodospirillales bacterium]
MTLATDRTPTKDPELKATIEGVRIAGLRTSVPTHRHSYLEDTSLFTREEAEKLAATTGVRERRKLPAHLCASDMCVHAAEGLLDQLGWDPASVEVLIFVSQDSDYVLPATACLIQRRLGLPDSCAAFDVNLGCSGFVYALWMASQLLRGADGKRALVLCGDTSTRYLVPGDRSTLPLFGDAGAAAAIEKSDDAKPMHVVMGTDGTGAQHILVKAGGRRDPLVPNEEPWSETERARLFKDGRLHMNGSEVFTFSLRKVPGLVRDTLAYAGTNVDALDHVVMHQANAFMLEHLRKKTGISSERFVVDMGDFGNTSSASIPLAIAHRLADSVAGGTRRVMLAGFGVGWSWAALVGELGPIPAPLVVEIPDEFPPLAL